MTYDLGNSVEKLHQWNAAADPVSLPADFAVRAWGAYLECIREGSYIFSVDELVAICKQAQVNVAIFKQIDDKLTYAGGWFDGHGPCVAAKLVANNNQRARSHFERLIPVTQVENFVNACIAEKQRRSEIEARAREVKWKEEAEEIARRHEAAEH